MQLGNGVKIWVFASFCSLLVWAVFTFPSNLEHLFNVVFGRPDFYTGNLGMFMSSFVGLFARFFGVILSLICVFMVWGGNEASFSHSRLEHLVEAALFLEGTYFVLLFPSGLWWLGVGLNFLGIAYLLMAVSGGSVLLLLSFKVRDFNHNSLGVLKWVGIAIVGYVTALWFNIVFRWFDMIEVIGNSFLLRGSASWGFLASLTAMSIAVVFAAAGAHLLSKNKGNSIQWFALSTTMIGINYVVYIAYSFVSGNLDSAMTMDIWTIPFLGLGLSLLRLKTPQNLITPTEPPKNPSA
ncbi:MAG: hypothetical protein NWF04_08070 [Candidatus Bathyarchaeota archaeon]|nr:hypothetical protein [Candidatus Bathyarchaeota archaeon]